MGKEEERIAGEFSENIDRMLAGEEAKTGAGADDDYRTALDFTRKLIEMRAAPPPAFQAQLKSRLLTKVREAEAKRGGFWVALHNIMYSPVWRTVTATVIVALVAVGVMWGQGVFTPSVNQGLISQPSMSDKSIATEAAPPAPTVVRTPDMTAGVTMAAPETGPAMAAAPPPVTVTATPTPTPTPRPTPVPAPMIKGPLLRIEFSRTPESTHQYGETVELELSFTNRASELLVMSPFPPEVNIERVNMQPPESIIRSFQAGTQEAELKPGESANSVLVWNQRDDNGQQVAPGRYGVGVTVVDKGTGGSIRGWATVLLILPPEGVLEKTIAVNQAQTDNGTTISLERVEMSATGLDVYAFTTPPGFSLPQGPQLPPPAMMVHAEGEYRLDGGALKLTGPSGIRFRDNGIGLIWEKLDPVPKNARELIFRITKLGEQSGAWEFRIPLQ